MSESVLPLAGVRVVEFVHMVMGPTCGLVLADDPHLLGSDGLAPTWLPDGRETLAPLLPLAWDGDRLRKWLDPPVIGEHTVEILASAGVSGSEIDELIARGVAIRGLGHAYPRR